MKMLYVLVIAAVAAACASIQPAKVQVGDTCYRCHRAIGDLRLAGETIDDMMTPSPFRTPACMARYIKSHPNEKLRAVFVSDYNSERMFAAEDAWFVPTTILQADGKTKEDDYLAFKSRADAAASKQGDVVLLRWNQVLAEVKAN